MKPSHLLVSVAGEVDPGHLVLHVDGDPSYAGQHVLVVAEVRQQVHDRVTDLKEHWLPITVADQWTWVV